MGSLKLAEIQITSLKVIPTPGGNVLHALKNSDESFVGFGEAYFSWVEVGTIKAWKRHNQMTMNLIVPVGRVQFVFFDDETKEFLPIVIGENDYARIAAPSGIWFGFKGINTPRSLVLNISNIPHDPNEIDRLDYDKIDYDWMNV